MPRGRAFGSSCGAKACHHQAEPPRIPAEMAARYGAETTVPDLRDRLVCSKCGSRAIDMV